MENKISLQQALEYEIHGSWWANLISHPVLQEISGWYFARKVRRKYKRYINSLEMYNQYGIKKINQ